MITLQNISKVFGLKPVLRNLSLTIEAGEFVALLGPNGAGKTTLLRLLSTLLRPTAGQLTMAGLQLPAQASAVRQLIGVIGHQPLLYPELTAAENLQLYADLYFLNLSAADIAAALDRVGLLRRQNDFVHDFSRGMQQRLAIARATLHAPPILLCDEPHTGLDQQANSMLDEVLTDAAANGCTVIMATHDLRRAITLAQRVIIVSAGKIAFDQPAATLNPETFPTVYAEVAHG